MFLNVVGGTVRRIACIVEGDWQVKARENKGRKGYGRQKRKGREAEDSDPLSPPTVNALWVFYLVMSISIFVGKI